LAFHSRLNVHIPKVGFSVNPYPEALGFEYHCVKYEMKHENRFDHRRRLCFFDFPSWMLRGTEA
jgi:hypothetical protein